MAHSKAFYSITLIIALIPLFTGPCFGTIDLLGIGFGVPLDNPCLSSFVTGQSCIQELVSSFLVLQPKLLGPQCCKSALAVDENCWPKIFPLNPYFPPQIKNFCLTVVGPLPPPVLPVQPPPVLPVQPPPVVMLPPPVITLPPPVTTLPPPVTTLPPPVTTVQPPLPAPPVVGPVVPAPPSARPAP